LQASSAGDTVYKSYCLYVASALHRFWVKFDAGQSRKSPI
jgi:hypothetical protein